MKYVYLVIAFVLGTLLLSTTTRPGAPPPSPGTLRGKSLAPRKGFRALLNFEWVM
jgi:hypothetical protein